MHSELNNLKYINLSIGNNLSNIYLFKLIKNAKKLKSLIWRLNNPNDISFFLSLIEDSKNLKVLNISLNNEEEYKETKLSENILN